MDANGQNAAELTTGTNGDSYLPTFFPDGQRLAFIVNRAGKKSFWSVDLASRAQARLLDLPDAADFSRLSPDGKRVAFNGRRSGGEPTVLLADLAGGAPRPLTSDTAAIGFPCWSPDGSVLAVEWKRGEDTHVATVAAAGGVPEVLTSERGQSWSHSFSPDGDRIAFSGSRNGLWNLYSISRRKKEQRQLTRLSRLNTYVRYPAWSPKGDQIVYEYAESTGNVWMLEGQGR
jgi:TolB protein